MRGQRKAEQALTGWGRTNPSVAKVVDVGPSSAPYALASVGPRGAIGRGLGRSYGDSAQNGGGHVLRVASSIADAVLDPETATVRLGAGVSIEDLLHFAVPRGFFPPVIPGTRLVTVGGAIASDIHGKNHHVSGSFGNHVERLTLLLADGTTRVVGPNENEHPELFWATVGGMGLTGLILDATVRLLRVESAHVLVDTDRADDLDSVMALMDSGDDRYRYSVAWIDTMATGARLGRSVLHRGDHAPADPSFKPYSAGALVGVPPGVPNGVINRFTIKAFNEMWFRKAPRVRRDEVQGIAQFWHPLDAVRNWNRIYGPQGFIQYQFVVPFGEEVALRRCVEDIAHSGAGSFLAVLKRFGAANPAPISFPMPGWTLTVDVGAALPGLGELVRRLDEIVLTAGGRHYLSKDSHMAADTFRRGYDRLDEWRQIRDKIDPTGVWCSDQSRRLGLTGGE